MSSVLTRDDPLHCYYEQVNAELLIPYRSLFIASRDAFSPITFSLIPNLSSDTTSSSS